MSTAIQLYKPLTIPVAGVSVRQGVVRTLREGVRVVLRRERDNEFDANAIALYTLEGDHFGYVPANLAARMVEGNPDCERWGGEVTDVFNSHATWGIRVRVTHSDVKDFPIRGKDGYIKPVPLDPAPESDGAAGTLVYSLSGRLLGEATDYDPESPTVQVVAPDGGARLFPAAVVTVKVAHEVL